jgi:ribA/ribD-fused uncharacterized protein
MSDDIDGVRDVTGLLAYVDAGVGNVDYLLFWGYRPPRRGQIGKWCLSQWWPASFTVDGLAYPSAEHYMMAQKAALFGDDEAAMRIRDAVTPGAAKAIGRRVRDFDEESWTSVRREVVVTGNLAKFSQNPELREFMLATGDRVLVEASPVDRVWGIGLTASDERSASPAGWRGLNLLGFSLMEVRHHLKDEHSSLSKRM